MTAQKNILFFKEIDKHDLSKVGGKGANLGEMTKAGFPVPNGFAVTVTAYDLFLDFNNLQDNINKILEDLDVNDSQKLRYFARKIQKIIKSSEIPKEVSEDIIKAYKRLSGRF